MTGEETSASGSSTRIPGVLSDMFLLENLLRVAAAGAILLGLYALSLRDYLLFHSIVEFAAIAVAFTIFILVWNTRNVITDSFFLLLGITFLFTGSIDLLHTLAYKGMGVFPGNSSDLPTQLWIAARYFQSVTFLAATLLIGKSLTRNRKRDTAIFFIGCAAFSGLLLVSIFILDSFPHAFIEGSGLTLFKIASEYLISLILIAVTVLLFFKREHFDRSVWQFLIASTTFLIARELAFTSYISVYGFMNMLGHLFRLISVYFFYRAIVVVGLTRPYDILFRELKQSETALRDSEEAARAILTAARESIYLFRVDGTILAANAVALERLGHRKPDEVIGHHFSEFMPPETAETRRYRFDEVIETGKPVRFEDVRDTIIFDHNFVPIQDATGAVTRIAVFSSDITDRKRAEAEILIRNTELNHANEELTSIHEELRQTNDELLRNEGELTARNIDLNALNEELTATQEELQQNLEELSLRELELSEKGETLKKALAEKEVLLSEIHHRVKNNLTAFISLLSLDGSYEETPAGLALRKDLQNRARSMALIHETLYRTQMFSSVDMGLYLNTLIEQIATTYNPRSPIRSSR